MTYEDRLKLWAIVRLMPDHRWMTVHRFRSRSDADGHLEVLRYQFPNDRFEVVFDPPDD